MSNIVKRVWKDLISQPLFQLNDHLWVAWHVQHDYVAGSDVFFHVHWLSDGADVTHAVAWQFTYFHAKGHNQAAFALGGAGTVVTASQVSGGQYRHMITETAAVTISGLEPDSVIQCEVKRVANGGVDSADNIFGFQSDLHYEADVIGTPNRTPPFYT